MNFDKILIELKFTFYKIDVFSLYVFKIVFIDRCSLCMVIYLNYLIVVCLLQKLKLFSNCYILGENLIEVIFFYYPNGK
jgi:hypothetical protein